MIPMKDAPYYEIRERDNILIDTDFLNLTISERGVLLHMRMWSTATGKNLPRDPNRLSRILSCGRGGHMKKARERLDDTGLIRVTKFGDCCDNEND